MTQKDKGEGTSEDDGMRIQDDRQAQPGDLGPSWSRAQDDLEPPTGFRGAQKQRHGDSGVPAHANDRWREKQAQKAGSREERRMGSAENNTFRKPWECGN